MLRGEIRLTDLDPAQESEAGKRRPAVLVSNDRANATAARLGRGAVTVVPVTSNVTRVFPFQALLTASRWGDRGRQVDHEPMTDVVAPPGGSDAGVALAVGAGPRVRQHRRRRARMVV